VSTRGSHAKLRRVTDDGRRETLTLPLHKELDVGTLQAIVHQAAKSIPESELRKRFYRE
jgi:predicted RNA binding protein YcfA (HicA-like mRNA interferase family)